MEQKEISIKFTRKGKEFETQCDLDNSVTIEEIINVFDAAKEAFKSEFCRIIAIESEKKGRNLTTKEFDKLFYKTSIVKLINHGK